MAVRVDDGNFRHLEFGTFSCFFPRYTLNRFHSIDIQFRFFGLRQNEKKDMWNSRHFSSQALDESLKMTKGLNEMCATLIYLILSTCRLFIHADASLLSMKTHIEQAISTEESAKCPELIAVECFVHRQRFSWRFFMHVICLNDNDECCWFFS